MITTIVPPTIVTQPEDDRPPAPTHCRHCGSPTLTPSAEPCYECVSRECQWTAMASLCTERPAAQE